MKFSNGCWLQKEGCSCFAPQEVYFTTIEENNMELFPNPTDNKLHISLPQKLKRAMAYIYTMDGLLVYKFSITGGNADISTTTLPNGTYNLTIHRANSIVSSRFIVQH